MKKHNVIKAFSILFTCVVLSAAAKADIPTNDNFASAQAITTGVVYWTNNAEATKEPNEPPHALNAGGKSVWYKYTATADGYLTVRTENSNFNTTLAVYKGIFLPTLFLVAANDDVIPVSHTFSGVGIGIQAGVTYYIAVDGHNADGLVATGNIALKLFAASVAGADDFSNPYGLIPEGGRMISQPNVGATKEPGEPNHANDVGGHSIWFRVPAPAGPPRSYTFSTRGSNTLAGSNQLHTLLAVYTGSSVDHLTTVGSDQGYASRVTFFPQPGTLYYVAVDGRNQADPGEQVGTIVLEYGPTESTLAADFDRDDKADISVFRPSSGVWYSIDSITGVPRSIQWGLSTDIPISGDLDLDGRTDRVVFRPETGIWYVSMSKQLNGVITFPWGVNGDIPQIYRDGVASYAAVFRPSNGTWYIRNIYGYITIQFGIAGDIPVMADYDGDGITDVAVFRPSDGVWYHLNSSNGQVVARRFGLAGDKPVAGDYDNDGRVDLAVYRPSNGVWYILRSFTNLVQSTQWGISEDIPQAADYDGDNRADLAVFRPSNGVWYVLMSSTGTPRFVSFGLSGDRPVTATNYIH